ncbi:hypothetical protein BSQ38_05970 [Pediococcus damnosus]|uniref:MBG domain-containing protein n=1 Tax=Pediococcus damnosus TaxID=51663 RepID=UPI000C1C8DB7|nr:MBG domain-containing protein [Pediococcus damnosus]PIO81225.1 hypothetical protein BSQ38_05970 [Pediococcus damnosus]
MNSSSEVISASSAVNSSSGSSTEVTDVVAASASTATDSGSQKSSSGGATSTVASTSAITKESSTDSSQLTSAVASSTTNETISSASSLSGSSVTAQASSGKTLNSVASAGPSAVNSKNAVSGDLNSEVYTEASVANNSTSVSAVSTSSSVAKISKAAAPISSALTTLQTKLPAGSVVTTQTDGTVVIALAVGADETAVKALVDKANLNTQVVIEAKDANVVVPNLNDVANINKAGDKYTGTSSTVAQDFTAAGTATLPSGNGYSSLTTKTQNQSGYLVLDNQLNFSSDFSMSGTIYLGDNVSKAADGLTFVFSPGNPSSLGTASTGGNLGLGGLANSFGLALDEHYNSGAYGDFDNADAILGNPFLTAATISWRTTDSTGKLNPNTRQGQGNLLTGYGNVSAIDKTSQVVAMNNNMIDGKAHAFSISYNATTGVLTITIPDNDNQNQIYKPTGATSATVWTRTLTAAQKVGMSLSIAASTGDDFNAFGVQINNYSYTKATSTVTYKEIDSAGTTLPGTITHTIIGNIGDTIRVFADQASANAAITAGTATAALSVVAPKVPGYVLQNTVSSDFVVGSSNVSLIYNKQTAPVTVHYQDYAGNMISKDATLTGSYGDTKINGTTTTNPMVPTITGYTFSATDAKNAAATVINFTALDANGNMYVTDANGKAITAITLYYKVNATVTLSGTETEQYTGMQQTPKASNYKITLPTGVSYPLKDSDIQLVSGGKDVGTYALELSTVGVSNITAAIGNSYAISFNTATGSFVITAADTKVTLSGAETEQYTGVQQSPSAGNYKITLLSGVTYALKDSDIQLVSGGTNSGTYEVTLSNTGKMAIQNAITSVTGSNYTVSFDSATAPFIIVSAKVAAELSKTNFDYDGTTKASGTTDLYVVIAVNDGSATTLKVPLSNEDVDFVTNGTNVNSYEFNLNTAGLKAANEALSKATNGNYQLAAASDVMTGSVTINKAKATISIISNDKITYDGNAHSLNIEVTGAVNGEKITYASVNNSHTTVGQYTVTAIADANVVNSNYEIAVKNGSMTIVKAPVTPGEITIGDANAEDLKKTYNGQTFSGSPIVQGPETDVTLTNDDYEYLDANGKIVTDPVNAGSYTIKLTQYGINAVTDANSDYDLGNLSNLTNNATIQKAQAKINITSNDNITYDGAAHSLDTEAIGAVNGETITYTVTNNSHTAVGQYDVSANADANAINSNYEITPGSGSMKIVKAPITPGEIIIGDANGNDLEKTYNGKTFDESPVVQGPEKDVTLSSGDYEYLDANGNVITDPVNAGDYTIKLTESGIKVVTDANRNFDLGELSSLTNNATIKKANANINIVSNDKITYDGAAHSLDVAVTGAVNGETIAYTVTNNSHTAVGQYDVAATADDDAINDNYNIMVTNGSMTIVKATIPEGQISIGDANGYDLSKTYDGKTFTENSAIVVQGPEKDVTLTNGEYAFYDEGGNEITDPVNAGNYMIKFTEAGIKAVTDENSGYELGDLSILTNNATINKAKASINITSNDKITYDGAAHSLDVAVTGAVNGETITYLVTNNIQTTVGQYDVAATADDNAVNSNYEITAGTGSMVIVKAPIAPGEITIGDVNGENLNKTYDGKTFDGSPVVQGPEKDVTLEIGDYEYLDANGVVVKDPKNAGNYTIKLTNAGIKAVTAVNSNYDLGDLSSLTNEATINKAKASINVASNDDITYDGTAHSLKIEVVGAANGETIIYTAENNSQTTVGQYDVTSTADKNAVNSNYEITAGTGSMTILKAPTMPGEIIIGDANGAELSKTYDGKTFSGNPELVVQGPENNVSLTPGEYAYYDKDGNKVNNPVNADHYTIKLTKAGIDAVTAANSNYDLGDLSSLTNNATINRAPANINIVSDDNIVYDGDAHSLDIEVTGAVDGETITYTPANNNHTTVGQYDVTATADDDNPVNSNYEITSEPGSMTIVKAPTTPGEITVGDANGEDLNKTYDGKTFSGNPVVQGPEKDVTLTTEEYAYYDKDGNKVLDPVNAGDYTIKLTDLGIQAVIDANSDYDLGNLTVLANKATIQKAKASINITSDDAITYDGTTHSLDIEVTGAVNGETITYTPVNNNHTTVGQYDVLANADDNLINSNYEITNGTGSMTIVKAPTTSGEITIGNANGNDLNKTYDGKTFSDSTVVQGPEKDVTLASGDYEYLDADDNVVTDLKDVGNYKIKLTESGIEAVTTANSNYELGDLTAVVNKATINKAKSSVNITSNDDITYDGDAHSLAIEVAGAVNGETITYKSVNNSQTIVGQYDVTATADENAVNNNYEIANGSGSMTIVKAPTTPGEITIGNANGNDLNKTYDGKSFGERPVVQGPEKDVTLASGDYEYLDAKGNVITKPVNADDYTIKLTESGIKAVTAANSDYDLGNLSSLTNDATIRKAPAKINIVSNDNIMYDGDAHSLDIEVTGVVNGETITYTTENNSQTTAGQYDVTATADNNAVNSNYEIIDGKGLMTIVKAPTTPGEITIGDADGEGFSKTYDGKTFSDSPVVQGPEKDVTLASGGYEYLDADGNVVTSPKNAGNYTIKLTESGIKAVTDANSDYDLGDLSKIVNKATISRAKATLTVTSNDDVTYDGKAHSLEVVSKGAVNGETITYTTDHNSNTNIGQYDVIVIADDTAVNENYDITVVKGSMTIVKATTPEGEISIGNAQGENINKTYDGKTFDENPVVQGPEIDVTLETGDYEYLGVNGNVVKDPVNAGDYQVRLTESGIDKVKVANSNYDLGDLTALVNKVSINKAKASLTVTSNDDITYDGKAHSLSVIVDGAVNGEAITYTTGNNNHANVGQYDVTVAADQNAVNSNYDITVVDGSMTIVKATTGPGETTTQVKVNDVSSNYGDPTPDFSITIGSTLKDPGNLTNADFTFVDKATGEVVEGVPTNVGDYEVSLNASGKAKVAVANPNYDLTDKDFISGMYTINDVITHSEIIVSQTVHYTGAGLRNPADKVQSITYDVATSNATGQSVYTPEAGYSTVDTPEIAGFTNGGDVAGYTPETTTVKPTDSTVTVTYKPTNELVYSEITVTRTIHYEGAGNQTPRDVIEKVIYKVVTNKTTGEVSYTPQGVFDAVTTPTLAGYTNSGDVAESIPTATMDKPEDSLVVVQYKKISDGNGTNPGNPSNPGGNNNKPGNGGATPTTPGTGSDSGTGNSSATTEGVKNSAGSQAKLETLENSNQKDNKNISVVKAGILPQTDEQHENILSVIGMMLLSGFLALFGLKRRKRDDEK